MELIHAILFGIIQGLTEFIPVSSSGHLVIAHELFGNMQNELTFDVALHIGTLCALVLYFYKDLWSLLLGVLGKNNQKKFAWLVALASVPAVFSGMLLEPYAEDAFRSVSLVSANLIIVGMLMIAAEHVSAGYKRKRDVSNTSVRDALVVGGAQALAVIPGVSRSGSTITAGLFVGLTRTAAARFSFLMAIPITFGAVLKVLLFSSEPIQAGGYMLMSIGVLSSFISGILAIHFLLKFVAKYSLHVFAYYRIALGVLMLVWLA